MMTKKIALTYSSTDRSTRGLFALRSTSGF
jgi:hypothetical protein